MQVVARDKKVVVAQAKKDCEELLVTIVQDKVRRCRLYPKP